jgi:hypothetical protein
MAILLMSFIAGTTLRGSTDIRMRGEHPNVLSAPLEDPQTEVNNKSKRKERALLEM